jgi:hypothetical protein
MSELLVALAMAAALGAKPAPAQAEPQQARTRPPASAQVAQVAQVAKRHSSKPLDNRCVDASSAF